MEEFEAFRVVIRSVDGLVPHGHVVARSTSLKDAIVRVLRPLGLGKRLRFAHWIDKEQPPREWLVVIVESSGQQTLFADWVDQIERDLEAEREAGAALDLARNALTALRRLSELARLTPVQFHQVLQNPAIGDVAGIHLGVAPNLPDQFVVRDPEGLDAAAEPVVMPPRVTLPDPVVISFRVAFVGMHSAYVHLGRGDGTFYKRKDLLYWGRSEGYRQNARFFYQCLSRKFKVELTCYARQTLNSKGKIVRLEWVAPTT